MLMKRKVELEQLVGLDADDVREVALEAALSCECALTGSWCHGEAPLWCCVALISRFLFIFHVSLHGSAAHPHMRIHLGFLLGSLQYWARIQRSCFIVFRVR
jgi:hypothetical protein